MSSAKFKLTSTSFIGMTSALLLPSIDFYLLWQPPKEEHISGPEGAT
jgi:hypothetical protein